MRVVLQNHKSLLYLKNSEEWTSHIKDALDFQQIVRAVDHVNLSKLQSMDVLMHFGDPVDDLRLRVTR